MARTSFCSKRIAIPSAVPITMSSSPRPCMTDTSESFSSMERALRPLGRGRENADNEVRLIRPFRVTKTMYGPLLTARAASAAPRASSSGVSGRSGSAPAGASGSAAPAGSSPSTSSTASVSSSLRGSSFTGRMAASFSSGPSWTRLTIALPRAARPACGSACTLSQKTRPLLVKRSR